MQLIAVVPNHPSIPSDEVAMVASALNAQVTRDLAPHWRTQGAVAFFPRLQDAPANAWFLHVVMDGRGKTGVHQMTTADQRPFAMVQYVPGARWSLAASHEALEMLVDPSCSNFVRAPLITDSRFRVRYLLEVCDPCQGPEFSYQAMPGNPARVSDFCLPSFFGIDGVFNAPFTFRNSITMPCRVARGGYLTWIDDHDRVFQLSALAGPPTILQDVDPKVIFGSSARTNWRGAVDRSPALHVRGTHTEASFDEGILSYATRVQAAREESAQNAEVALQELDCVLGVRKSGGKRPSRQPGGKP